MKRSYKSCHTYVFMIQFSMKLYLPHNLLFRLFWAWQRYSFHRIMNIIILILRFKHNSEPSSSQALHWLEVREVPGAELGVLSVYGGEIRSWTRVCSNTWCWRKPWEGWNWDFDKNFSHHLLGLLSLQGLQNVSTKSNLNWFRAYVFHPIFDLKYTVYEKQSKSFFKISFLKTFKIPKYFFLKNQKWSHDIFKNRERNAMVLKITLCSCSRIIIWLPH